MKSFFKIALTIILFATSSAYAQVGMMTNYPDKSAVLDMKAASNKGVLIPNVSLNSTTDVSGIAGGTPAQSLLVFNTNASITGTNAAGTGYYYWDTNIWKKLTTKGDLSGDNLGNHTATMDLNMNSYNINSAAKTSTQTAAIAKGTDGVAPAAGYLATSADASGNVVWKPAAQLPGSSSVAFFVQSTGQSQAGASTPSPVPGLTNVSYTASATGNLVLQLTLYTELAESDGSANPSFTNTQIRILCNGSQVGYGMSTPMGASNAGLNPECTTIITRIPVTKGTTYTFTVDVADVYNYGAGSGSYGGTFIWEPYSAPSTLMGTLLPN